MFNSLVFKEYDIRGIVGKDIDEHFAETLGKAFGTYLNGNLIVGRDNRFSSEKFGKALIGGLISTGGRIIDIGMLPTPVFYFAIQHFSADGGIMITASHNPPEYNGFKLCRGTASLYGEEIKKIGRMMEEGKFLSGKGSVRKEEIMQEYAGEIFSKIKLKRKVRVVTDSGNGTAGIIGPKILRQIGCEVVELFSKPDASYPNHHPDPTIEENLKSLKEKVVSENAEVGIGWDGDADRMVAVDEKGNTIYGDQLIAFFSKYFLLSHPKGKIVFDVKCSQALPEYIKKYGGEPIMWKTGHSLIEEKMKEAGSKFSGEMSGHLFFKDRYYGYDDGIYAACRLVEILSQEKKTLSELISEIPKYFSSPELRLDCSEKEKFEIVRKISSDFSEYSPLTLDGVRVNFGDGWFLIRASNTQPKIVVRFEAKTEKRYDEIENIVKKELSKFGISFS